MKEQRNGHPEEQPGEVQGRQEIGQGETEVTPLTVTLRLPGPDERGFLRRIREVQGIMELSKTDGVLGLFAMWGAFASWLADHGYVETPAGVDPHEAVQELSRSDLNSAITVLAGIELPRVVDPQNADS